MLNKDTTIKKLYKLKRLAFVGGNKNLDVIIGYTITEVNNNIFPSKEELLIYNKLYKLYITDTKNNPVNHKLRLKEIRKSTRAIQKFFTSAK